MISPDSNFLNENSVPNISKKSDVPLEHLDYKYVNGCEDVKELEKIFRVLASGVEGKYPDLENHVAKKIERLNPASRALRKDQPILSKMGIPKDERSALDNDLNDFVNRIESISKVFGKSNEAGDNDGDDESLPPVRNKATTVKLDPKNTKSEDDSAKPPVSATASSTKSKKSPKPRDYNDWAKIERMLDNEEDESEEQGTMSNKSSATKKLEAKVVTDKTQINNTASQVKESIKKLPKPIIKEDIDESLKELKADQEKCKGNESFKCGCFEEALHYYTKSIQYLPTAASFNNRAMTYLKLEKWDLAIEDCNYVLKYETENIKALMRRSTAYLKKKKYAQAKTDIDKVLQMEATNKKALELQAQISAVMQKAGEEEARVKSLGGKRLQIEESDTDDEDVEEKLENILLNSKSEKPASIQVKDKLTGQKTSIKITEVESEDCEETDDEEIETKVTVDDNVKAPVEPVVEKVREEVKIELPKRIVDFKDKANAQYASGQYSDALEFYTFAVDALKAEKTNDLELDIYYKNTLSILYSNRASCNQKIGDFKASIRDCDEALTLLNSLANVTRPHETQTLRVKVMLKKSAAYEALEKFKEAFLECEELMKIDHTNQNAQRAYNRLRSVLKETGEFDKLRPVLAEKKGEKQPSREELNLMYNELKAKGNEYVKKGEFNYALGFYTKCIELDPANTVGYLNRSLCYVKLNQPDMAIADSGFVLERDASNVKALYRRASAYKIKKNYDLVAADLKKLLSLEPNNQIAAKEYKEVCELVAKSGTKKVLIDEVAETRAKEITGEALPEPKKKELIKEKLVTQRPVIIAPVNFTKISNGYEFLQGWNSVNPRDIDSYGRLLTSMSPNDLPVYIGSKLDDDMLSKLIKAIHRLDRGDNGGNFNAIEYLKCLSRTQRFNVTKLFLDKEHIGLIKEVLAGHADSDKADSVQKAFDL